MKIGFLFPGQGAQTVGMGKDFYEAFAEYREVYDRVSRITKQDIAELTFSSDEETLSATENTQIAVLTMSLAIAKLLEQKKIKPEAMAGLSLGEYTALIYDGVIGWEDGIRLVQTRGKLMSTKVPQGNWAMAAIIGLEDNTVENICKEASKIGFVVPANYNCPGQVAISGEKEAVLAAMEKAKAQGAKRAIELKTSGPFHTSKLTKASQELAKELEPISIQKSKERIVKNVDGTFYEPEDDIKSILVKQMISPVHFTDSIKTMCAKGIDTFIEVGPGKVLSGFVKKTNPEATIFNVNNVETFKQIVQE